MNRKHKHPKASVKAWRANAKKARQVRMAKHKKLRRSAPFKKLMDDILFDLWEGFSNKEIAVKRGITQAKVSKLAKKFKMPGKAGRPRKKPKKN